MKNKRILYISYNGIEEPLVRSQVLNYLERLAAEGYRFTLLTFERKPLSESCKIREALAKIGIDWYWLPCHRGAGLLSTVLDVCSGFRKALVLCRSQKIGLVHARSFVPAVIARAVKSRLSIPFLNDIRGFWLDEKVYKGSLAPKGIAYRLGKALEGWVYGGSDAIVSLTDRGLDEIRRFPCFRTRVMPPSEMIPTCVDTAAFSWKKRTFHPPFVFGYIGSLGPGYLPDAVFRYFALARRRFPGSRLHLITHTEPQRLWSLAADNGIPLAEVVLRAVAPQKVAEELSQIDVGLSFIQPHFAKLASCPTKVGEYLAAGIPVVSNSGIGDLDRLIGQGDAGYIVQDFTDAAFSKSLSAIEGLKSDLEIGRRCRQTAEESFSLSNGVTRYGNLYRRFFDGKQGEKF